MKQMKKIASILLLIAVVLTMTVGTAFAAGTNSITVNGAQANETYKIFKMLDLSVNADMTAYSYTVNTDWNAFFTTGAGKDYVSIDTQGYVTWKTGKDTAAAMEAFGKAAAAFATMSPVATQTPTEDGSFVFEGLDAGYYLITSSNGTLAIVDTTPTKPAATVNEKNKDTVPDKQVKEDSTDTWGKENSAQIGDTVYFKTTFAVKKGARNYVMHDKMEDGLTFNADSVAIAGLTKGTDYTVVVSTTDAPLADSCTFEVRFAQTYLDTITADTELTVTYSAVLNENADITLGENNNMKLTWGDKSGTDWDKTNTKTYQFAVLKFAATDTAKNPLAGATFQLKDASGNVVKLVKVSDTVYRVANGAEAGAADTFTTVASDKIVIKGVDLDSYTLVETAAPAGYNLLKDPVNVTVEATNAVTVDVPNASGLELPSTGGIGTTIFYVLGAVLVIGAGVLLVTRRRMDKNN